MYNEAQKERFINELTYSISRQHDARRFFDTIEPFEEKWGGDICTRSVEDISSIAPKIFGLRNTSQTLRLVFLREYAKWCLDNNIPGATDSAFHIDSAGADVFRTKMVTNPRHLQRYMDLVFEPEDRMTIDNTLRAYLWLAFFGMYEEDALRVKASDVHFDGMYIRFDGDDYVMCVESLKAIRNCVTATEFAVKNPTYISEQRYKKRSDGDILLRGTNSPLRNTKEIRAELSRKTARLATKEVNPENEEIKRMRLTYTRVQLSGVFYRIYEFEQSGGEMDFLTVADWYMQDKEYHVSSGRNTIEMVRRKIAKSLKVDYERWKDAFRK